jgi:gamma-glutamyltranspeptidase/glutathione hydrolase
LQKLELEPTLTHGVKKSTPLKIESIRLGGDPLKNSMIVAPQPDAVETGAIVLKEGGNAVDAAIACAFVQTVVDPLMCGLAGFGSMQIYFPDQNIHEFIDFHGKVPAAARPDMWQDLIVGETDDGFGFVLKGEVNDIGYQSITVPGSLKAFYEAHSRFGSMPWRRVIEPAVDFARDGYVLTPDVFYYWVSRDAPGRASVLDRLRYSVPGRRLYCDITGSPLPIGSTIKNPDLADTLSRIVDEGSDIFYHGEIAKVIDTDMKANGGLLSAEDLAAYEPQVKDPLWGKYRGYPFSTNRPPGGGIMLIEMLNILENFDLVAMGHNTPEYIRVVSETMKIATTDKDEHVGDPDFVDVPVDLLTDKAYAKTQADKIQRGETHHVERLGIPESQKTTHISVLDQFGNAVSMTHSLGMMSGVITEGLGFMYNGCMAVFDPRPGHTGSIAPGKSRFSSICPTILFSDEHPALIIGAPGGTQIAMGVLQVILNVIDFAMPIAEAIRAPRFSATSDVIDVCARIPRYAYADLETQGCKVRRSPYSYDFASVHAIRVEGGHLSGSADILYGGGMALEV